MPALGCSLWFLISTSALVAAVWHQTHLHKGPYDYCPLWHLGFVLGVLGAIAMAVKQETLAAGFQRFPLLARFCFAAAGLAVLGLGAAFAYLALAMIFPAWFSSGPPAMKKGVKLWLLGLAFALILGAMGLAGVLWGLALLVQALKGPAAAGPLEA